MYNPGYYKISNQKVKEIITILKLDKEDVKKIKGNLKKTKQTLKLGDMQPARVISTKPLLVSCYSDEFDGVLIYEYPDELVNKYQLKENMTLVSLNSYWPKDFFDIEADIIQGEKCSRQYRDVICFIPLFLCHEKQEEECREATVELFDDAVWNRLDELTKEYLNKFPNQYRQGFKTLVKY